MKKATEQISENDGGRRSGMRTSDKKTLPMSGGKLKKGTGGIIFHVIILFLVTVLLTGALTYVCETYLYDNTIKKQMESRAAEIADETKRAVTEYPAHEWLVRYWYDNSEALEIEYDAVFDAQNETAEKCRLFLQRHPDLELKYLTAEQCETLSAEDQRLYAEIVYSWLITRVNQIKQSYHISFLFCVISEEPFDKQFFLFSGADPGAKRGNDYEDVYPLGNRVSVLESQTEAMRAAIRNSSHLAYAGSYVDYYSYLASIEEHSVLIALTYDLSSLRATINTQTRVGAALAILNQLVLSAICLLLILLFVVRPLKKVQHNIRLYTEIKDSKVVTAGLASVRSRNEIGQLAKDTSEMIREIDAHMLQIQAITAEKEHISTELTLATRIQAAMLPSKFPPFPDRHEFDIYACMDPAKAVGGDFYDFFLIDEDHLGLVIADVSGKGVPAALFMMVSKILLKNYAMTGLTPAQTLEAVNRQICANNPEEMFVTVWFGVLEISSGKLTASNAGHEYPVLKNPEGDFAFVKDKHGLVIGGMEGVKYKEYELTLTPGAKLFVYTDGVPEATNAQNEMFGADRLLAALNRDPGASPEQLLKNVRGAVNGFVKEAEQFDDLTMLCIAYQGTGDQSQKD